MSVVDASRWSGITRKMAARSDFARVIRRLIRDVRDSYRREPRYARAINAISRDRDRHGKQFD